MRYFQTAIKTALSITVLSGLAACQTLPADSVSPQEQAKVVPPAPPIVVIPPTEYHTLEKCDKPLGTLRVNEFDASALATEYNLPAPRALVQWFAVQSNCFKVVDLDSSLSTPPAKPVFKKPAKNVRLVPTDYTVLAKVDINTQASEAFQGVVGTFSPAVGAVQSPIKTMDASTQLALTARRSKSELGVAVGKAGSKDFSFNQLMGASTKVEPPASLLVYESKPEGRLLAGAFVNSFNQMVKTAQDYQAKTAKKVKTRRAAVKPANAVPAVSVPSAYVPIYKRPSM